MTKRRALMKCTRNALYSYLVSEMEHNQKDYKVKMYIPRESANQNVAIVGERNDEDQTVQPVMKLTEKLTDEEVDEMILETDVHDTQCSEQIVDVPVPRIADIIVEVVTAFHSTRANPITSRCTDRQHVRKHTK